MDQANTRPDASKLKLLKQKFNNELVIFYVEASFIYSLFLDCITLAEKFNLYLTHSL